MLLATINKKIFARFHRFLTLVVALSLMVGPALSTLVNPSLAYADNDILVAQTGCSTTVNESGSTDSFTVQLSGAPSSNVVISVTSDNTNEVTASPSSLTFTPSDWNMPQSIRLTGVNDTVADGDKTTAVALSVVDSLSDSAYQGKSASTSVITLDNEPSPSPGFAFTEPDGETKVNESGTTDTFTVVLRKQPSANVVISVTSSDSNEVTVSPASLTFTRGTWSVPQTVTVTGVDDTVPDGDKVTNAILSIVDSLSADEYDPLLDQTVCVTTVDNEVPTPGFSITESDGNTTVNESGATDAFTVALTKKPTANVVISVTSSDSSEMTISPSSLTFTSDNWSTPQTVTVTGVDDTIPDGDQVTPVVLSIVDSLSAEEYRTVSDRMVSVTTVDNEPPVEGIAVKETGGNTIVSESGTEDTFTVALTKEPMADVVLSITSSNTSEVTVSPGSLTFTKTNWASPQSVTVTGVDDTLADGDQISDVVLSVVDALSAEAYRTVADKIVKGTTLDNETATPGINGTESGGTTVVSESGTTDTFSVALNKRPTADVVISITSSDTTEVTVAPPASLTFTPSDWNVPQVVTVKGVDDTIPDGDQVTDVILSVVAALSAEEYRTVPDKTVKATTIDDEPPLPGFAIVESGGNTTVNESGTTDTFTIVLTKKPTANVVISLTSSDTSEMTVSPSSLTFTPDNWNTPRTGTVRGVDDTIADGDQVTHVILAVVRALSAEEYQTVPDRTVKVTTIDNDPRLGPTPISPPDGAQLNTLGPLLQWAQRVGTTWFQVQVIPFNNDGPGIDLIIGETIQVGAARYQVKEPNSGAAEPNYVMLPDMTYTWRVRTATTLDTPTAADWTAWSMARTFGTASKSSGTISRVSPAEGSTLSSRTPTLVWSNSDTTVFYYEVQVSKDLNFGTGIGAPFLYWELRHGGLTNPLDSYTIPSLFPMERNSTYYWRVRPRVQGDGIPVAWSSTFSFKTQ